MKKHLKTILFAFFFIIFCACLLFAIEETNRDIINYNRFLTAWTLVFGLVGLFFGLYLSQNKLSSFLKVLLPSTISIIGTIWFLSTGYLNIKAENLKNDINKFTIEKTNLLQNLQSLKNSEKILKDSLKIKNANNKSLEKENQVLFDTINENQIKIFEQKKSIKILQKLAKHRDKPIIRMIKFDRITEKVEIKLNCYDSNLTNLNSNLDIKFDTLIHGLDEWNYNLKTDLITIIPYNDEGPNGPNTYWNQKIKFKIIIQNKEYLIDLPYLTGTYDIILQDLQ